MTQESISKKLSELFELHKSGALTKEEFEKLKKQILSEDGVENVEKVKKQEQEFIMTPDKPIQGKKGNRIWMLSIIATVLLVVLFLVFKTDLFSGKIGLSGLRAQTVKDIDGNIYKTVTIGAQVWMAENLKTTKYNDGNPVPLVKDEKEWVDLTTPAFCWYDHNIANKGTYGALYNWYTVKTNKLCPNGWHVPTNPEWTTLINYLGGKSIAGGKLKEMGTTHWKSPNTGATNETGFNAIPSGFGCSDGTFMNIGYHGYWWSSTVQGGDYAFDHALNYNDTSENVDSNAEQIGLSVRCLKDE